MYYNITVNIYLDIDGVLLANDKQPALGVKEFLTYFIDRYPTYWLTTHCKGDAEYTINHIHRYFDLETMELLKKIKATNWSYSKTEAIDFTQPFIWFDDQVFEFEKEQLRKNNCLNSWINVDLRNNPSHLKDILELFKDLNKDK